MAMVTCPGCLERDERIAALERRVAALEARLGTNATNSGLPPSASPPGAPKPVTKKRTGKKPGGQSGHPPRLKRRLPRAVAGAPPAGRPRALLASSRGVAQVGGAHHRIPGALPYLPLLWPTQ